MSLTFVTSSARLPIGTVARVTLLSYCVKLETCREVSGGCFLFLLARFPALSGKNGVFRRITDNRRRAYSNYWTNAKPGMARGDFYVYMFCERARKSARGGRKV